MKENSGIQIQKYNIKVEQQKDKQSIVSFLFSVLCLWMAAFGIFYGITATFGVAVTIWKYLLISFCICLFWSGIFQIKQWFGFIFVFTMILYLYIFYQGWDKIMGGFIQIYNAIVYQINTYYQLQLGTIPLEHLVADDVLWTLGIISFLPSGILAVGTVKQRKPILIVVLEALPIVLALILGLVVPLIPSMAMAFALIGIIWMSNLTVKQRKRKKTVIIQIPRFMESQISNQTSIWFLVIFLIAASFALTFSNQILEPKLREFDYIRVHIQNSTMEDLWVEVTEELINKFDWLFPNNPVQSGGISGGKLGNIGEWKNENKVHLKVYSKEELPYRLYLKAYVGSNYENNQWKPRNNYPDLPGTEIQSMGWEMLDPDSFSATNVISETDIIVDNIGASSLYSYVPYFSNVTEFEQDIMDATIRKQGRSSRTYPARIVSSNYINSLLAGSVSSFLKQTGWYNAYENFVYEQYLQLPERGMERIMAEYQEEREEIRERNDSRPKTWYVIKRVREILKEHAVYSTNPGVTPSGEDFNDYFLYEQKKGLCMHFASAGTVLCRFFGIPARYVEGYILPRVAADKANEVVDSYAHAWVEIWNEGFGWIPIEVTPGYEEDLAMVPADQFVSDEEEESTENTTEEPTSEETEESTESSQANEENNIEDDKSNGQLNITSFVIIGIIAVILSMLFIGVGKWRYIQLKCRFTGQKRPAVAAIAKAIRQIQQISCQTWQDCGISEQEMEWFEQLALKARFSEHLIDRREVQKAEALYWNLADQIVMKSSFWIKFKIKWIYCLR